MKPVRARYCHHLHSAASRALQPPEKLMNPDGDVALCPFAPRSCALLQDHHLPIGTKYSNCQRIWSPICCCALVQLQYSDVDVHEPDGIEDSQQVLTRPLNCIMATSRDQYLAIEA
jgi:hypothetical protein